MSKNYTQAINWKIVGTNKEPAVRVPHTGSGNVGVTLSVYGGMPYRVEGIPEWAAVRYGCRKPAGSGMWKGNSGMAFDIPKNEGGTRTAEVRFIFPDAVYQKEHGRRVLGPDGCYVVEDFVAVLKITQEANPDYVEPVEEEETPTPGDEGGEDVSPNMEQMVKELLALVAALQATVDEQAMQIAALSGKRSNTPF